MTELGRDWGTFKNEIINFINSLGINPVYLFTIILLIVSYRKLRKLKIWDKLELYDKMFTSIVWLATIFGIIASMMSILKDLKI